MIDLDADVTNGTRVRVLIVEKVLQFVCRPGNRGKRKQEGAQSGEPPTNPLEPNLYG